jgi:tetratricopeptide (TPR) repeat protein
LEAQNRLSEANTHYNEAVRLSNAEISGNRGTRDTYTALTWALQRLRRYAEVITRGEQGLRLFPDEERIVETMGEAYFYLGSHEASLRFLQRYVNRQPRGERASTAYFFIGEIYRLGQKFLRADIAYTTAVAMEPGLALWWYRLGSVRESLGDFGPAREAYERALRLNPGYGEAREGLERVRQSLG